MVSGETAIAGGFMRSPFTKIRPVSALSLALLFVLGIGAMAAAQSQEPKPELPATPIAASDASPISVAATGVSDSSWTGPNWGVSVAWDPAEWTVEAEFIDEGYDGIQLGTPLSTVYVEAYDRFEGDTAACLADAAAELASREGVTEVVPLSGRPLPVAEEQRGDAQLFGLTLTLEEGTVFRGVEYIECRSIGSGAAILEITWQTITETFNQDFTRVETLLESITVSGQSAAVATPVA